MKTDNLPNFKKIFEDDDPAFYHLDRLSAAYVIVAYVIADSYKRDKKKLYDAAENLQNFAPALMADSNVYKIHTLLVYALHVAKTCKVDDYVIQMIQITKDYYEREIPPAEG